MNAALTILLTALLVLAKSQNCQDWQCGTPYGSCNTAKTACVCSRGFVASGSLGQNFQCTCPAGNYVYWQNGKPACLQNGQCFEDWNCPSGQICCPGPNPLCQNPRSTWDAQSSIVGYCGVPGGDSSPCPKQFNPTQQALDECYMRLALNYGTSKNPSNPFGAVIVEHSSNTLKCFGFYNGAAKGPMYHAEITALMNCTALFPAPTGNPSSSFGKNHTIYSVGEPCPMCTYALQSFGRIVYGSDVPTLITAGFKVLDMRCRSVIRASVLNALASTTVKPIIRLKEHVLKEDCDRAFYAASNKVYPIPTDSDEDENVFY